MSPNRFGFLFLAFIFLDACAAGQKGILKVAQCAIDSTNPSLVINVTDSQGYPFVAEYALKRKGRKLELGGTTFLDGTGRIPMLPPGTYTIYVGAPHHHTLVAKNIKIVKGTEVIISATLLPGEDFSFSYDRPFGKIDFRSTETGITVRCEQDGRVIIEHK